MNLSKPIFLFAYANDMQYSLELEEEERAIRDILAPLHDQGIIEYLSLGSTSIDDLYKTTVRLHNRIFLFHYSGHSGQSFLELTDGKARASFLSLLLGQQEKLKLVFLNGCANVAQVDDLFQKGIKAVIATSTNVLDQNSIALSRYFYQAFVGKKSIKDAFDIASARLKNDNSNLDIQYRGIELKQEDSTNFPWGLYTKEEKFLKWKISFYTKSKTDINYILDQDISHIDNLNHSLFELMFEGMSRYKSDYKEKWKSYKENPNSNQLQYFKKEILDHFPHMLSFQVRDLYGAEESARIRLFELNEAYLTLAKYLAIISLSNVWDASQYFKKDFFIRPEYLEDLLAYINQSVYPGSADTFDYIWLISTMSRIFEDNNRIPFIEEFVELHQELVNLSDTYEAYRYLEQFLRNRLYPSSIDQKELINLCRKAEEKVGILFRTCAFLITYQLITIKGIDINNPRKAEKPGFVHYKAILQGAEDKAFDKTPLKKDSFASNQTVFVAKDFKDSSELLSLSPLILDLNAFEPKAKRFNPDLFFFCGFAQGKNEYEEDVNRKFVCYERSNTPGEVKILLSSPEDTQYIQHYLSYEVEDDKYKIYKRKYEEHYIESKDLILIENLLESLLSDFNQFK